MEDNKAFKNFTLRVLSRPKFSQNDYLGTRILKQSLLPAQSLQNVVGERLLQSSTLSSFETRPSHTLTFWK